MAHESLSSNKKKADHKKNLSSLATCSQVGEKYDPWKFLPHKTLGRNRDKIRRELL